MKNVQLIRQAVIRVQSHAFERLRYLMSVTEGGFELVDQLRPREDVAALLTGMPADTLLARVVEMILTDLGHETALNAENSGGRNRSQAVKAVRKSTV